MGKVNNLNLFSLMLIVLYLGISALTTFIALTVRYSPLLLCSLMLALLLFVPAILAKRSRLLLISWILLGADFIFGQALLIQGPNILEIFGSVIVVLLAIDLCNFLEFLHPMRARDTEMDEHQYLRTWSLLKKHIQSVLLFGTFAGVLGVIGTAVAPPIVFAPNPTLAVGIAASILLISTSVLILEWRGERDRGSKSSSSGRRSSTRMVTQKDSLRPERSYFPAANLYTSFEESGTSSTQGCTQAFQNRIMQPEETDSRKLGGSGLAIKGG